MTRPPWKAWGAGLGAANGVLYWSWVTGWEVLILLLISIGVGISVGLGVAYYLQRKDRPWPRYLKS